MDICCLRSADEAMSVGEASRSAMFSGARAILIEQAENGGAMATNCAAA